MRELYKEIQGSGILLSLIKKNSTCCPSGLHKTHVLNQDFPDKGGHGLS